MSIVKRFFTGLLVAISICAVCTSCVTSTRVRISSDIEGAEVYIDGEKVGTTPTQVKLSNAVWSSPDVILKKDGYKDLYTELKKEVKAVNLVFGILLWTPSLLWCYGPKQNQNYFLTPATASPVNE